jgi:hypothetical protein
MLQRMECNEGEDSTGMENRPENEDRPEGKIELRERLY